MGDKSKYFLVKQKAVPEVLLKVVEAKRLLESERAITVQEATEKVGISRSSFYKYKDDILPFYDNAKGKTITLVIQMDDGSYGDSASGICKLQGQYPDDPSKYSGWRSGYLNFER